MLHGIASLVLGTITRQTYVWNEKNIIARKHVSLQTYVIEMIHTGITCF